MVFYLSPTPNIFQVPYHYPFIKTFLQMLLLPRNKRQVEGNGLFILFNQTAERSCLTVSQLNIVPLNTGRWCKNPIFGQTVEVTHSEYTAIMLSSGLLQLHTKPISCSQECTHKILNTHGTILYLYKSFHISYQESQIIMSDFSNHYIIPLSQTFTQTYQGQSLSFQKSGQSLVFGLPPAPDPQPQR